MNKIVFFIVLLGYMLYGGASNITVGQNSCYTIRKLPIKFDIAFEAMKETFLKSNINLVNLSKEDGFLYGKGFFKRDDDIYSLTISVSMKDLNDITKIKLAVSYSLTKEEHAVSTAGVSGINFPIAVPWKSEFNVKETGNIQDPDFYTGFYINFSKTLYDNLLRDKSISLSNEINTE